jgi:hypothetical protein
VDVTDRSGLVVNEASPSRNLALVVRDDDNIVAIEDAPDGDSVDDACEDGSRLDPRSMRLWTHGGSQLSMFDG